MRILALTQCYPRPGQSGHCISQSHQIRELAREHDIRLVVPVPWPQRLIHRRPTDAGQDQNVDRLRISYPTHWYPPKVFQHSYGQFYLASIRKTVRRILDDFAPDVVFACWAHPDGWAAVRIARELGVPVIIKVIGSDVLVLGRRGRRRQVLAETLRAADGVIAVSGDLAEHVIELGLDARKVHVVPEGIDMDLFTPGDQSAAKAALGVPADARMLLFVGNLLLSKGAGVLIEACGKLASRGVGFSCYLVGRGKDESKLRAMVQGKNLIGRIIFAGASGQRTLVDWYRAADVIALPSFSEGIPNVLREALQCRRPFVATRVGGIPEISDPSVSRLVASGDVAELSEAMEAMLASPPRVSETIPSRFNITWNRSAEIVTSILRATVSRGSPNAGRKRNRVGDQMTSAMLDITEQKAPPSHSPFKGRDMLCFSHDWSGDPLSKTHLMRVLARENRVLWVNSIGYRAPTVSKRDLRRAFNKLAAAAAPIHEPEPNIFVVSPLAIPAYGNAWIRALNRKILVAQVKRAMRLLRFRRPINWVFNPAASVVAGKLGEESVIYYCVDEYTAFSGVRSSHLAELEEQLLRRADLVIVSAQPLYDSKIQFNPRTILVRHGVDYSHFRAALSDRTKVPPEIASLPHPIVGFFGLIADWVDVELMGAVARHFASGSLVVLGKATTDISILKQMPNVHILGRKPYEALPSYCKGFDVAINPFRINTLTLNANPLKVREYLAAGLPVVSTAIPEVEALGQCRIGRGTEGFIREIEAALQEPGPCAERSRSVSHESWEARLHAIGLRFDEFCGSREGA